MKRKLFFSLLLIPLIAVSQNLITNGNFEAESLAGWQGYNNQILNDEITNSRVGNVNFNDGSLYQVVDVNEGETYIVRFNYRWVSGSGNYNLTVRIKEEDTPNRPNIDLINGTSSNGYTLNATPNQWFNNNTFSFTVPSGITRVRLLFFKTSNNNPFRLDNVSLISNNYTPPSFVDANTPINAQPDGVSGDWILDFSDEFNDTSLNLSKWYKSVSSQPRDPRPNLGVTDWRWIAENAFLNGNGQLVLRSTKINSTTMRCGSIESRNLYEPQYGYLEARIKIATTSKGNHTAFWMQGHNQSNVDNSAADGAEVDIFESAWVNDISKSVVHYDGYGPDKKNYTIPFDTPNIHNGYHTFGLLWTETEMYVYYDGVRVISTNVNKPFPFSTNPVNGHLLVPNVPQWLWLSVGASFADGDFQSQPNGILSDAEVDYVRVYKPNQETLSLNKTKKTGFSIYPNPVKDTLNVVSNSPGFSIVLFDATGKEVLKQTFSSKSGKVDTDNYEKGIYFFKVINKQSFQNFKVIF